MTILKVVMCAIVIGSMLLVPVLMNDSQIDIGFFWHVSDLHYDKDYTTNGSRDAMCHYRPNHTEQVDIGPYGDPRCEAPRLLIESAFNAMRKIQPDPDFVLWTGDNMPHIQGIPWSEVYSQTRWLGERLRRSFSACPVVPTLGNHDCSPSNHMRPDNLSLFLSEAGFKQLLPSSAWSTFEKAGYYSWKVRSGIRLVCLNSVLWYTGNLSPAVSGTDEQLLWLQLQLHEAQQLGEKVFISGHVPPGFSDRAFAPDFGVEELFRDDINDLYQELIARYRDTVAGQFFGHLHRNGFVLISDSAGHPVGSAQLAASVTPWTPANQDYRSLSVDTQPMVRLYKYDRRSAKLLDYTVYYMNLDKTNSRPNSLAKWEVLYTLTTEYSVPDASTASMVTLAERLERESWLLDRYIGLATAFKSKGRCDSFCRTVQLCGTLSSRAEHHAACLQRGTELQEGSISILVAFLIGLLVVVSLVATMVVMLHFKRTRIAWTPL